MFASGVLMRQLSLLALFLLILSLGGCGAGGQVEDLVAGETPPTDVPVDPPAPPPEPPAEPPAPPSNSSMSDAELEMALTVLDLVNVERANEGLPALTWDDDAAEVAYAHSVDMDVRGYFDHTNPDGQKPWDRLSAAGVPWSTAGENIAMGYATPEAVMVAWMNSPGHRDNILREGFTHLGIGVHDNGSIWWTQVFLRP